MKIAGLVFVVYSAASIGMGLARSLRRQSKILRQFLQTLQLMKSEIACCATPLPQVFALMAASASEPLEKVFTFAAREMNRNRGWTPFTALQQALLHEKELNGTAVAELLSELGLNLGKYDTVSQCHAIDLAIHRTEAALHSAEQDEGQHCKTFEMLGVCTGLALAILLL